MKKGKIKGISQGVFMKRKILIGFAAFIAACPVFAQDLTNIKPDAELSDKGFYVYVGLGYGFEKIDPDPKITYNGLNGLIGLGYDFGGRISIDLSIEYMLLAGISYTGYGYSIPKIENGLNGGIGADLGIKLINNKTIDLILPLGVLFRVNRLEVTQDNKKKFSYTYLNLESGLIASFRLGKSFYLTLPFYIGYPVYKNLNVTNYTKKDFDVINFSIGFCVKRLFV